MDAQDNAFKFASDFSKQLITLATGIIALTITFLKDVLGWTNGVTPRPINGHELLNWAWYLFFLSILFGVWLLMALTGELEPSDQPHVPSIRGTNVVVPAALQIITFLGGLALTVMFGSLNF